MEVREVARAEVAALCLVVASGAAGCFGPDAAGSWTVTYLGQDVEKPAIALEDDEVRSRYPELVEAMEEVRRQGVNSTAHALWSDTLAEFLQTEGFEQENVSEGYGASGHYIYNKYQNRVNWTGSTFRLDAQGAI